MPPPHNPVEASGDWDAVEAELGLRLPRDYRDFVETYGSGHIGGFLGVHTPFSSARWGNLRYVARAITDLERESKVEFADVMPYAFYPEQDGLLPVMQTDNGDTVYWLASGEPDSWRLVVNETRSFKYQEFEIGVTDFIAGVFTGTTTCDAFPALPYTVPITFRPDSIPHPVGVELFVPAVGDADMPGTFRPARYP